MVLRSSKNKIRRVLLSAPPLLKNGFQKIVQIKSLHIYDTEIVLTNQRKPFLTIFNRHSTLVFLLASERMRRLNTLQQRQKLEWRWRIVDGVLLS